MSKPFIKRVACRAKQVNFKGKIGDALENVTTSSDSSPGLHLSIYSEKYTKAPCESLPLALFSNRCSFLIPFPVTSDKLRFLALQRVDQSIQEAATQLLHNALEKPTNLCYMMQATQDVLLQGSEAGTGLASATRGSLR
jgi:hypothetical protein